MKTFVINESFMLCGTLCRLGWDDDFQPEGRGSTPALAATYGPWASPFPAVACALRRETPIQYPCRSRERLW